MIYTGHITLPAAETGPLNPLPDIMNNTYIHAGYEMTGRVTPEEAENIGKGMIPTMLPYLTQDGYTRERSLKEIPCAVLENERLKAVFLPSLGGRLWSLTNKRSGRELLYVNPVFQPCNLALRNAWFSGGVEFNVGIKGHNPLTCSPLFAEVRHDRSGSEILSMYEFERIRGVVFSVNAWLPEGSDILYIRNVIENTAPTDCCMYWWTNMAIPSTAGTRILVPADESFVSFYNADHYVLDSTPVPNAFGTDVSYPVNLGRSMDFFYKLPDAAPKWIASADETGRGLLHFSESMLKGRKLFLWGQGNGGKHWGEYLAGAEAHSGEGYLEIQAGLARTQLEHFIMKGESTLSWTECFAPLEGDPALLHADWKAAQDETGRILSGYTAGKTPEDYLKGRFPDLENTETTEKLFDGSGFGRIENRVREKLHLAPISRLFTDWETADHQETALWQKILDNEEIPDEDPSAPPVSYMNSLPYQDFFWEKRLREITEHSPENSVLRNLLGVMLFAEGKEKEAEKVWETAAAQGNPFALRNLAAYHGNVCGDKEKACIEIEKVFDALPENLAIAREYAAFFTECENSSNTAAFLERYDHLPEKIRQDGRMLLYKVRALIGLGRTEEAGEILTSGIEIPDIKEGELSTSALWFKYAKQLVMKEEGLPEETAEKRAAAKYPLPYSLDFRMHE